MAISDRLDTVKDQLQRGDFASESAVSQGVLMPILQELGWAVFNSAEVVIPEYQLEGRRVDFALCHPAKRPVAFVEVKNVGLLGGAARQLFEYAFHAGVPMAVLTDGREWTFFLPGEQGSYDERKVCNIHLLEQDVEESARLLERYLSYERVCSGDALAAARSDYQNVVRARETQDALPKAWHALLEDPDSLLIDLLADKYEELNGYRPDLDSCHRFLDRTKSSIGSTVTTRKISASYLERSKPETNGEDSRRSESEIPRGSVLIKLSDFSPITSGKQKPPVSFLWPNGTERRIVSWKDIFVEVAEWLISRGKITVEACPIYITRGRNYHINHTEVQFDGKQFVSSRRLSNGLYLNTQYGAADLVRYSNTLLTKFDQDPSRFLVRMR